MLKLATVAYILRTDLNIRHKSQDSEFETCWIELILPTINIILGVVYTDIQSKKKIFFASSMYLKETLSKVARENRKVILIGDFNLNFLKFDTNTEKKFFFLDLLRRKWLTPHILGPTITSQDKPSLILNIEKLTVKLDNQDRPQKRDFKNFDEDKLVRDNEELNLKQKIENFSGQINQNYKFSHENIMKVIDKNAPLKRLTKEELKISKKHWITKGILTLIKKKIYTFDKDCKIKWSAYILKIQDLPRQNKPPDS